MIELVLVALTAILIYVLLASFIGPLVGLIGAILVLVVGMGSVRA